MVKKNLILVIMLVLIVFSAMNAISAENVTDTADNDDVLSTVDSQDNDDLAASKEITIETTDTNDQIQEKINSLKDGDTLNFQTGEYKDVCLYINKSVTINGNGATLYGYDRPSVNTTPDIIINKTDEGGYAITNLATLYILKTDNLVLKDINFVAGANSGTDKGADSRYSNCVLYNYFSNHTTITNISVTGCSWGIWFQNCAESIIENNKVQNQLITGIFNFQSPRTIIRNNTVTNAKNHGIDVRHGVGPNVKVLNNTVIGSKEGIYLLHSAKHIATGNTIINCTLSSITCCGASHITISDNKFYNSRIGVLLGGGQPVGGTYTGYNNITIGKNEWKIDELPFPPTFQYYVAEAKGDYANTTAMMGTHTDSSLSNVTYEEYTGIESPKEIVIDYDAILKPTGKSIKVAANMTNTEIQELINGMNDGDALVFEKNAVYKDICIYITKNIKIIGNNATLISYESANTTLIPEKMSNTTANQGFAIGYLAVIYCVNNTNAAISDLNIVCKFHGYKPTENINQKTPEYCTAGIYSILSTNLTITNCNINGASWGMYIGERQNGRPNAIITNNKVSNQFTTGILCFGSKNSIIANNTVKNAVNHGIDVRFQQGSGVTVFNNTVSGSKEGIYLLHSTGHKVYNNTLLNSKISSITCYGSGNEYIFNNTLSGSRIAIMLGGGYYNVTIGANTFKPDKLPFPPTFEYFLVKSENKYYDKQGVAVQGTYKDSQVVNLTVKDVTVGYKQGSLDFTLKDSKGKAIANKTATVTIGDNVYKIETDANGAASLPLNLTIGNYTAKVHTVSDYYNKAGNAVATITVEDDRAVPVITASSISTYLINAIKGTVYKIALKDANGTAIAGKQVTLTYNGNVYTTNTTKNGIASFKLVATKLGSKSAVVKFAGDDTYKAASKTATIKVISQPTKITAKKASYKATKAKKYTVIFTDNKGKAIKNAKISLKIKGLKTITVRTTTTGKATFTITKLTKVGSYKAYITFAGSKYYTKATAKSTIIIKK